MRRSILVLIALASLPSSVLAQRKIDWDKVQVKTQKLDENVYMLQFIGPEGPTGNVGGNVGALISEDGITLVDCGYAPAAPKLKAPAKTAKR